MIWLLLGILLFGGASGAFSRPQGRIAVFQKEVHKVVGDEDRRAVAQEVTDRMANVGAFVESAAADLEKRVRDLDADPVFREDEYRVALESALDQIDDSERRMLDLRMKLRDTMTAEEWTKLLAKVQAD